MRFRMLELIWDHRVTIPLEEVSKTICWPSARGSLGAHTCLPRAL
jgi:hypothetical protein